MAIERTTPIKRRRTFSLGPLKLGIMRPKSETASPNLMASHSKCDW